MRSGKNGEGSLRVCAHAHRNHRSHRIRVSYQQLTDSEAAAISPDVAETRNHRLAGHRPTTPNPSSEGL
jgi:hypothetical protein